jgi:hypothetical protein
MVKPDGVNLPPLEQFRRGYKMKYLLIVIGLFLIGCSGSKSVIKEEDRSDNKYDESFDPMTLDDNDIVFPSTITNISNKNSDTSIKHDDTSQSLQQEVNGFRVQIIATQDLEKATLLEEEAKNQFSMNGHKTYLVFEAPLYKIRLGDFTSRDEADELKMQAINYGYRESFIVRTKVIISK